MKRALEIVSFLYVSAALLVATKAVASLETTFKRDPNTRSDMESTRSAVPNHQRLDQLNKDGIGPYDPDNLPPAPAPENPKSNYIVTVWTASWCGPCKAYKAKEVPALQKLGYTVIIKDIDKDKPPKGLKITSVPTVVLRYKSTLLKVKTYWKAKDINKYVDNLMSLKGTAHGKKETTCTH